VNIKKLINLFISLYPVWIILSSIIGFIYPPAFVWFSGNWMVGALALVMLGMGITLNVEDFKAILLMKKAVLIGAVLQFTIMPLSALLIGKILNLSPELAVGLIIVGCCPGGTASNVIAYLGRGHLALSIIMTSVSTMTAIMLTPLLCDALAGQYIPVDAWGMFLTTIKVVLIPVTIGVFLNYRFPETISKISISGPFISVWAIVFIAGSIVAQSADTVAANAIKLFGAAGLLHVFGFLLGYIITSLFKYNDVVCRTVSIEVGMQNGGLAAVLAKQNFPLQPMAAVPAVFSSVMQTIIGGLLAAYWRWKYTPKSGDLNNNINDAGSDIPATTKDLQVNITMPLPEKN
jgi:bile acid:Na+ symporter, BASS family